MSIKGNKGVTLIALTLTVILLLIITAATIYSTKNNFSIKRVQKLKADIEALNSKIDDYYLTYGDIPILCDYCNKEELDNIIKNNAKREKSQLNSELNVDDGNRYCVIDLEKLGGVTLNYGYDQNGEYRRIKQNGQISNEEKEDEIYIINTITHQIYFPHGIFLDNIMYYYDI